MAKNCPPEASRPQNTQTPKVGRMLVMRRSNMWAGDYRAERRPHLNAEQSDSFFFFVVCVFGACGRTTLLGPFNGGWRSSAQALDTSWSPLWLPQQILRKLISCCWRQIDFIACLCFVFAAKCQIPFILFESFCFVENNF